MGVFDYSVRRRVKALEDAGGGDLTLGRWEHAAELDTPTSPSGGLSLWADGPNIAVPKNTHFAFTFEREMYQPGAGSPGQLYVAIVPDQNALVAAALQEAFNTQVLTSEYVAYLTGGPSAGPLGAWRLGASWASDVHVEGHFAFSIDVALRLAWYVSGGDAPSKFRNMRMHVANLGSSRA